MAVFGTSSVLGPVIGGFLAGQDSLLGIDRLALDLLRQRAAGAAGVRRRHARAAPAAQPPRAPHRLAGRAGADHRPGAAADRRRAGPHLGLGLRPARCSATPSAPSASPRSSSPSGPTATTRCCRCACSATAASPSAARAASSWAPACSAGSCCSRSVPADRPGLEPHGRRAADDPAGRRHHDRRHELGHRDLAGPAGTRSSRWSASRFIVVALVAMSLRGRRRHLGVDPGAVHGAHGRGPRLQLPAGRSSPCRTPSSRREMGVATSSVTFFRQMGGTIGVAAFLSLLFTRLPGDIGDAVQDAGPREPGARPAVRGSSARARPAPVRHVVHPAAARRPGAAVQGRLLELDRPGVPRRRGGRRPRLLRAAASCPELPLRTESGIQARQESTVEEDVRKAPSRRAPARRSPRTSRPIS